MARQDPRERLSGKLGNRVYSKDGFVREHVIPRDPKTPAQLEQRELWTRAAEMWLTLTDEEKRSWAFLVDFYLNPLQKRKGRQRLRPKHPFTACAVKAWRRKEEPPRNYLEAIQRRLISERRFSPPERPPDPERCARLWRESHIVYVPDQKHEGTPEPHVSHVGPQVESAPLDTTGQDRTLLPEEADGPTLSLPDTTRHDGTGLNHSPDTVQRDTLAAVERLVSDEGPPTIALVAARLRLNYDAVRKRLHRYARRGWLGASETSGVPRFSLTSEGQKRFRLLKDIVAA